jgi:hypothetical protein
MMWVQGAFGFITLVPLGAYLEFGKDTTKLDQFGCVNSHNRAANQFNMQLHDLCTKFRAQLPEANITYVDIFSVKLNLISNYSQYGKRVIITPS